MSDTINPQPHDKEAHFIADINDFSHVDWEHTFTGRQFDRESGLLQFRNRFYDGSTGRFVNRDPLGYVDGANVYRGWFVVGGMDSSGLHPFGVGGPEWEPPPIKPEFPLPGARPIEGTNGNRILPLPRLFSPPPKSGTLRPPPGGTAPRAGNPKGPIGVLGGTNKRYPPATTEPIGAAGAETCIIVVVNCPDGIAVYHFTSLDDPSFCGTDYTECHALICGGNEDPDSLRLRDDVITAVETAHGLILDGIVPGQGCGVNPGGGWYEVP